MFPQLSSIPFPPLDPVAIRLGPLLVRWYGLAYVVAFFLSYLALRSFAKREVFPISERKVSDLVFAGMIGVLLGGRLGWWLVYHEGGIESWYEPFAIWQGGMSFHGGLLGVTFAAAFWARSQHEALLPYLDALSLVAPLGLFFGRISNFINAELRGRPTSVPWGVVFPGEAFPRHPSQLYEAFLEGPLLLCFLFIAFRRTNLRSGQLGALFLIGYGILRFGAEFTRAPDAELGFVLLNAFTMGQLLSGLMVLFGVMFFFSLGHSSQGAVNARTRTIA